MGDEKDKKSKNIQDERLLQYDKNNFKIILAEIDPNSNWS